MSSKKLLYYERHHKRVLDCYRRSSFDINIPLNKLKESKLDFFNVTNLLRKNGTISQILILLFHEMHLQNYTECSGRELAKENSDKFSPLGLRECKTPMYTNFSEFFTQ